MSVIVCCQDNYSYGDPSLNRYNYLRYSDRQWRLYNPPIHLQNRLRYPDFVDVFERTGFEILEKRVAAGAPDELECVDLAEKFFAYRRDDLV
jgi:hypothetical protein